MEQVHHALQGKGVAPEKQVVTALPDVKHVTLDESSRFLILACDGIWDILTNEKAVDFVKQATQDCKTPRVICEEMCDHCLATSTEGIGKGCDNMSAMVVLLKKPLPQH
jgi:serine/threonine protein phosphatase PrpC